MVINHNMSAMYSNRSLGVTNNSIQKDMEKLSSGMRINRAGDDASGLAVSEKMRSQIRGLNQASTNAQKEITLETGAIIMAPLFINIGEKIRVNTTDRSYGERVK